MMSAKDIERFLPDYPLEDNYTTKLFEKKEFQDIKLGPEEVIPEEPGISLLSQELQRRFLSPETTYDKVLLFHGMGTGKCVVPSTIITTSIGRIPIEEFYNNFSSSLRYDKEGGIWTVPQKTVKVPSFDEKSNSFVFSKILHIYSQYIFEDIVYYTTESGFQLGATKRHRFLVEKNGKKIWKNMLGVGDEIYVPEVKMPMHSILSTKLIKNKIVDRKILRYRGFVYDLEVENTHNYIANDTLCHNTCTTSLIVENFKNTLVDGKKRKKAIVLVPNTDLAKSYKSQVQNQCTANIYEKRDDDEEETKQELVKNTYSISTYNDFLKNIKLPGTVKEDYSNRIIIIDEVHHFKIQTKNEKESIKKYEKMQKFLDTVENCRVILLTGTPIWDKPHELASVMNLILPPGEKLPTKSDFNKTFFDKDNNLINQNILEDAFRKRVSFLRPMITSAKRTEMGVTKPWLKHIKIYPSAMSEFQSKHADSIMNSVTKEIRKHKNAEGKIEYRNINVKGGPMGIKARDAATFVFPEMKDGKPTGNAYDGKFSTLVTSGGTGNSQKFRYKDGKLRDEIKNNLEKYSSKFAAIVDWIVSHPNELVFVFGKFVNSASGVLNLGIILQSLGFQWVNSASAIRNKGDKKRFAIISSQKGTINQPASIESFINAINRPENKYGDYCQILIGTSKIAEGISLKNFRQIHNFSPHWNNSLTEQALARGFRVGSHKDLNPDERYIRIFRHCAVSPGNENIEHTKNQGFPMGKGFDKEITMDAHIYKIAETKEFFNTQLYRVMKKMSWDCPLTYGRNVLPTDEDYSRECDYQKCNYTCDGFEEKSIDKREKVWKYIPNKITRITNDLFYSNEKVRQIIRDIVLLFENYFNLHFEKIRLLINLDSEETNLLLFALNYIIETRMPIKNRYGFESNLKEDSDIYFLDDSTDIQAKLSNNIYTSTPFVLNHTPMDQLINIYKILEDSEKLEKLSRESPDQICKKLGNIFKDMNHVSLIVLTENVYSAWKNNKNECIEGLIDAILNQGSIVEMGNIAVHKMHSTEYTGVGYNVVNPEMKADGLTRIFKNGEWSYITDLNEEKDVISQIKNKKKQVKEVIWDDNNEGIVGFIDTTGKFKIMTRPKPTENPKKGSVCMESSWSKPKLIELFHEHGIFVKPAEILKNRTRSDLLYSIRSQRVLEIYFKDIENLDKSKLRSILTLHSYSKEQICKELENWTKEKGVFI